MQALVSTTKMATKYVHIIAAKSIEQMLITKESLMYT